MPRVLLGVWFGVLAAPWLAHADITFDFAGVVTQVSIDDLSTGIQPGAAIAGTFTFDSTAPDLIPAPSSGSYLSTGPAFGMTVSIDGLTFSESGSLNIGILNSFVDQYTVTASSAMLSLELFFQDNSGTIFNSDTSPLSPPLLSVFAERDFHLDQTDALGSETQVDGRITALTSSTVSAVPEPSFLMLLFTTAVAIALYRLVRSKSVNSRNL
ncbi:MAG TPA: hypothetical protein VMH80_06850 [Bryobacteraceae bacterium]|nr:hypothetical protein [Bryobacteraceae bacterium]